MRLKLCILGLAIVFANTCASGARPPESNILVVDAIVERIGQNPGVGSGVMAVYQLAKYTIVKVCAGEYAKPQIVVDHLLLTAEELNDLRVGDRVRLNMRRSKTIFTRNNEDGFREATDEIGEFYISDKPVRLPPNSTPCDPAF